VTARLALSIIEGHFTPDRGVYRHDHPRVPQRETGAATDAIHRAAAIIADLNPREAGDSECESARRPRRLAIETTIPL